MFRNAARIMRLFACLLMAIALPLLAANSTQNSASDPRLQHSFRQPEKNGWTFVHLEGKPADIGFQHGYLLAPEIADMLKVTVLEETHDSQKDWQFFRDAARDMMWPRIDAEYREELQGIVDGANAKGVKLDLWDVVALNGAEEWEYYVKQYNKEHGIQSAAALVAPEHCSAFVADRQLYQGRQDRHRAQQLDKLSGWPALDDHFRYCSRQRQPHADGRTSGVHPQRGRFRHECGWDRNHGNYDRSFLRV